MNQMQSLRPMAVLALAGVASVAAGQIIETPQTKVIPKLTVRGEAEFERPADQLGITIGVVTEDAEAQAALSENSRLMAAIILAIEKVGLTEEEYQTGRFRVRPNYSRRPRQAEPDWRPQIIGYEVTNTIVVETGQLDLAGPLIEAANRAGANSIDNIRFDLADKRTYRREAIARATVHALDDARALAEAAELRLVRILSISLDEAGARTPEFGTTLVRGRVAEAAVAPPITPGDVTVTASVTVVYEIAEAEAEQDS